MYHSINFGNSDNSTPTYNTYDSFHLIPDGRPLVKSPGTKTAYVDVPGADGSIDYTEALNGLKYENRKGSWTFFVLNTYQTQKGEEREKEWSAWYSAIMSGIHGKYFDRIWLEDDSDKNGQPQWAYRGRISVNEWKSDPQYSKVVIDYNLDPYKYPTSDDTVHKDWLWDDLTQLPETSGNIMYGTFNVQGSKKRTILGSGTLSAWCSTEMLMSINNLPPIMLNSGINNNILDLNATSDIKGLLVTFIGTGQVELYYGEGRKL